MLKDLSLLKKYIRLCDCPVRALKMPEIFFMAEVRSVAGVLRVAQEGASRIQTISNWIVQAAFMGYEVHSLPSPLAVWAHSTNLIGPPLILLSDSIAWTFLIR